MTDLNHVVLIGRLTRDLGADERSFGYVGNGQARANVSIAVNRSRKQADGSWTDEVNYFDVTIWGKTAENLKPYLLKGKQICVEGYLKQDRWEKDGQKFSKVQIVANNVQLLGGKSEGSASYSGQSGSGYSSQGQGGFAPRPAASGYAPQDDSAGVGSDFPEDIPF